MAVSRVGSLVMEAPGDFAPENVSFDLGTVLVLEFRVDEGEEVC